MKNKESGKTSTDAIKVYETASEAVNDLVKRGYTADLSAYAVNTPFPGRAELDPARFVIDEIHRFEGATDPGDEMVVFAVSSADNTTKGLVVNAFGPYSSNDASGLVSHLQTHQ
ncbi:MAG: phosphoribosylpyrophosphate synthetase [Bacteroidia bacterium]